MYSKFLNESSENLWVFAKNDIKLRKLILPVIQDNIEYVMFLNDRSIEEGKLKDICLDIEIFGVFEHYNIGNYKKIEPSIVVNVTDLKKDALKSIEDKLKNCKSKDEPVLSLKLDMITEYNVARLLEKEYYINNFTDIIQNELKSKQFKIVEGNIGKNVIELFNNYEESMIFTLKNDKVIKVNYQVGTKYNYLNSSLIIQKI
ncbi:hypothetical protein NCTC12673_gp002 [Campylobacter phage NCTC12673]|uniref:Uncharacterized protein n=2 Tax=Fletchervirus NCTC12673 TaxID=934027 RepID=A0A1B0XW78_9CAUD|nr:hypothetical protein NCTC12673_gp002 [Campylobacter phage NCTC12673]YP_009321658.1 hypothetical protein BOX06_gp059 [Campylobacter phage PC14]AEA86350.1 hypothetical protein [Campylobacter phage NCTC12673]ANH51352.1 hypothetical protein PC14_00059 [Campylobacter phage PC14]